MTKKRPFLDLERKKKQARKNGPPQYSMRSVDHVAGSATLVQGCERSFSGQGLGLLSKCSAVVLDGQLVSAVLRFSVG